MNYINCDRNPSPEQIRETMRFWLLNTIQHIEILTIQNESFDFMSDKFLAKITAINIELKKIYEETNTPSSKDLGITLRNFLKINNEFINLLQRLKFEGSSGLPVITQEVYHYLYEQIFIRQLFSSYLFLGRQYVSVPINTYSNDNLFKANCEYSLLYTFSMLSSQHTSIILNISSVTDNLPNNTIAYLERYRSKFNDYNEKLSEAYIDKKIDESTELIEEFIALNQSFIDFLLEMTKPDNEYLPESIKVGLPDVFFDMLDHIISEQQYAQDVAKSFIK